MDDRARRAARAELTPQALAEGLAQPVPTCDEVSEETFWATDGPPLCRARRFRGVPQFYPVYRCGDLYSHSPLPLILHKRSLRVDRRTARHVSRPDFQYASGRRTIDRDIVRLGGPPRPRFAIKSAAEYARQIASAMRVDVADIESRHPECTNVVLCGGRDSLTLLLLPWKNPVVVASAPPNHGLVQGFVHTHGLRMEVVCLDDDDSSLVPAEILANACRNALEHCRWGPALRRLALAHDGRAVFWKGQLGAQVLTPVWERWCHPPYALSDALRRLCRPLRGHGERALHDLLQAATVTQRVFFSGLWYRGAMWQGAHMSMLRLLTGALVLSAYHGPAVREVVSRVDLRHAVRDDVRPRVADILYGSPVRFPEGNPGPPVSRHRRGLSHLGPFARELAGLGVRVSGLCP